MSDSHECMSWIILAVKHCYRSICMSCNAMSILQLTEVWSCLRFAQQTWLHPPGGWPQYAEQQITHKMSQPCCACIRHFQRPAEKQKHTALQHQGFKCFGMAALRISAIKFSDLARNAYHLEAW